MDKRTLPIEFRPPLCRAKPLGQTKVETTNKMTERDVIKKHRKLLAPKATPQRKKGTIPPPPSTEPNIESIKLNIRRRDAQNG